mgnify:CR=1 FL=1
MFICAKQSIIDTCISEGETVSILEAKILKVLDRYAKDQTNLGSYSAREMIAKKLALEIDASFEPILLKVTRPQAVLNHDTLTLDICVDLDDSIDY